LYKVPLDLLAGIPGNPPKNTPGRRKFYQTGRLKAKASIYIVLFANKLLQKGRYAVD
jgi:hypothetical protein